MKRVFTWSKSVIVDAAAAASIEPVVEWDFVAEEDIVILGAELIIVPHRLYLIANDGAAMLEAHLSQTAIQFTSGELLAAYCNQFWNTAPAAVNVEPTHVRVMLPEGAGMSLREEGHLFLLAGVGNSSAASVSWGLSCIIYYLKGKLIK